MTEQRALTQAEIDRTMERLRDGHYPSETWVPTPSSTYLWENFSTSRGITEPKTLHVCDVRRGTEYEPVEGVVRVAITSGVLSAETQTGDHFVIARGHWTDFRLVDGDEEDDG